MLRFPDQQLDIGDVKRFSEQFGEIQGNPISAVDQTRPFPEVGILSNVKENGGLYRPAPDAGQDWHTDMSYRETMGFVNGAVRHPHPAAATASRWAAPSSPTCTPPTTRCRTTSRPGSMA